MRKGFYRFIACICLLGVSGAIRAERLDVEQARQAAASFFCNQTVQGARRLKAKQLELLSEEHALGIYVFNREDGGTVFVADDDALGHTVLGYTDSGSINLDSIPLGMQDWLNQIGVLMNAVHEGKISNRAKQQHRAADQVTVQPLIKTTWDQWKPYNNLTPTINDTHCVTGCVATAIAQVLNYWRWPESAYDMGYYTFAGNTENIIPAAIDTHYDWDNMLNSYNQSTYTQQQADAVAQLMRDCGYAVGMIYGLNESAAPTSMREVCRIFNYKSLEELGHYAYSEEAWHLLIQKDLQNGRPIIYSGQSSKSGHAYIVDGCKPDDLLHVNWGWGGYADGWFVTTDMQGYNNDQFMFHGFEPNRDADAFSYTLQDGVLTINGSGTMPYSYSMENAPWRSHCREIKKIVIGSGITSVVESFGYHWTVGAEKANYYENVEEISLPEGLTYLGNDAFFNTKITEVELPASLQLLNYAFRSCSNLKKLRLGPNVLDYRGDRSGVEIEVDKANPYISVSDNVLYSKDGTWLKMCLTNRTSIVIPEQVNLINADALYDISLIICKPTQAPKIKDRPYYTEARGVTIVPHDGEGYTSFLKELLPNFKQFTCSDMDKVVPQLDWSLEDGMLSLKGLYAIDNLRDMPFYDASRYTFLDMHRIEIGEGIVSLGWSSLYSAYKVTEITLPSTLAVICPYSLPYNVKTITCTAYNAPYLNGGSNIKIDEKNGVLRVPNGAKGYDEWIAAMPSGWKIEYFTPEPLVKYATLTDNDEHGVASLDEWQTVQKQYPNTVGVLTGDFALMPYLASNIAYPSSEAQSGYLCPEFKLTDLSSGYMTADKAPLTGFKPPVSFDVVKGTYTRRFSAGYNSCCLPFEVQWHELPNTCSIYTYSHFDSQNDDAIFTESEKVEPSQPCYILSRYISNWTKSLNGCIVLNTEPAANEQFCGTYVSTDQFKDRGYAPRTTDNIFAPLAEQLHPFRACFILDTPANVHLQLVDSEGTRINQLQQQSGNDGEVYRLDGVRITGNPQQRGIYLTNGKLKIKK